METATAPIRPVDRNLTSPSPKEIVVLAGGDPAVLTTFVSELVAHITAAPLVPQGPITPLTIAVTDPFGTGAACWVAAEELADSLAATTSYGMPSRLDHKERRAHFAGWAAAVVAFVRPRPGADIEALLRPLRRVPTIREAAVPPTAPLDPGSRRLLTRRGALGAFGGIGITVLLAACGKSSSSDTTAASVETATASSAAQTTAAVEDTSTATEPGTSVALAPELTEGPYYLDLDLVRSDVVEDREGAPFALGLRVLEASTGAAISGAAVDIWHCDANGIYSGFQSQSTGANGGAGGGGGAPGQSSGATDDATFLRGTQLSDVSGLVTFATIYPGWYTGRTVQIHVKVHVEGSVIHIGQLFFDDTFTDTVYADNAPYSARSARGLRNDNDGIFQQGGGSTVLAVSKSGDGYTTEMAMGVRKA